jgi:fructose-bisphosphate aldolase class I
VGEDAYSNEEEMYAAVHAMRTRIVTCPAFGGDRILGAILFENTLDRTIRDKSSSRYLWEEKQVVPFLKVDKGLAAEESGAQLMKPIPNLDELLEKAKTQGVFGTKMRSVIKSANADGIARNVDQQFEIGRRILAVGLVPILEPEVDIHAPDKSEAEAMLRERLLAGLKTLGPDQNVMFKLTLPEEPGFYRECQEHPRMVRVVALSGGYSREDANRRLAQNHGMIASFSRALSEGLSAQLSDEEFTRILDAAIQSIFEASST